MASSLPASLFLLSVVFCQFLSAAGEIQLENIKLLYSDGFLDQNSIKAEPGQNVFLPCKDTDQGEIIVAEWTRTDLKSGFVLLYRDGRIDLAKQLQSYKDRMDLLVNQIQKGDASLVLKNTTIDDSGTYECRVKQTNQEKKRISTVSLVVAPPPPEPFPVWATVLLVLALVAAAGVSFYFRHRLRPGECVELHYP
ncbi:butyrophilin subfamily 2 member A2-like isoform X2 [Xiphophorus hellerii]|uniref:butyrophilin subfamily 2 member A2-like isoform X2 n=1 Tax=Xiphophorus hellerii TaxID=8084 RepID=UPI0013B3F4CB|nr:butyrophilin subfamily 2 member A2-like isoform X2 [Xiphophorus hellerii]